MADSVSKRIVDKPFFSIGVPTYNRKELLLDTVASLLDQKFDDYEIIIANDYVEEEVTWESLGVQDPRIRIVNNRYNLGELENMNALLGMARGRYFSWQFDDDPVAPSFLDEAWSALSKHDYPACVFTAYQVIYGAAKYAFQREAPGVSRVLTGRKFLRSYLSGSVRALGCCGFYRTDYLRRIGGAPRLSESAMALHAEYLLLIRTGLLESVAYIDSPLVSTRAHTGSWTTSSRDKDLFKKAGIRLIRECLPILREEQIAGDFRENLTAILVSVVSAVVLKACHGNVHPASGEFDEYCLAIKEEFTPLFGTEVYGLALASLETARGRIPAYRLKAYLKKYTPLALLAYFEIPTAFIKRRLGMPF